MVGKKNCILRLSRYKNELYRFKELGFIKIFSEYLAEAIGVTSAQVRKDFSLFGISGNKRGGYNIDALIEKLNAILGKNQIQKVIVVGAGNLGSALLKYKGFEKQGIKIDAAFDIDRAKSSQKSPVPIHPVTGLEAFIRQNGIRIAILCVPEVAAQATFDSLVRAGIKGVLNFSPIQIKNPGACFIANVNLEEELENLIYFVNTSPAGRE
ncbi:MAG: redox-sensing transcriptional repressor Rex [Chitinispirillaceae bacterium]|jgi:redox-sensing transcriptional repressor|nr:redox-sensing transcriptional repressor Rex [Chitinispirillaceae bacterium]